MLLAFRHLLLGGSLVPNSRRFVPLLGSQPIASTPPAIYLHPRSLQGMNAMSEEGVLVIGDGFFANLRSARHYSERVCFAASITFNSILAVLLIREKNQTLKPYSRVLLINVAADLFYTIMSIIVEMDLELNSGVFIWALNGLVTEFTPGLQKFAMSMWIASCCVACLVSTIEFIFRYFLVVRHHTLNHWQLLLCVGIILACGSFDGMLFFLAMGSVEDHAAQFGHLMAHPMWHEGGNLLFYGTDIGNGYFLLFLLTVTVQDTAMFVVIALSTFATVTTLRKTRHQMSEKARYMQAQVNRLMFAEVFSLVSVAVIPIACMMPLLFFKVKYAGAGLVISLFMQYIPSVNPITTIFLVGPYRRKLFGKLGRRASLVDAMSTSAHSHPRRASDSRNCLASSKPASPATTATTPQLDPSHI